jgi:hypothetical protein
MAAEALSYLSGINWPPPSPPCHQPLSTPFIFYVNCRVVERSAAYNHQQTDSFIAQILCKVGFYHNAPCPYNIVLYFLLNYVSTIKRGRALPGLGICWRSPGRIVSVSTGSVLLFLNKCNGTYSPW